MNHSRRADRRQYIRLMLRFREDQKRALKRALARLHGPSKTAVNPEAPVGRIIR